jgi:hypothetical protein
MCAWKPAKKNFAPTQGFLSDVRLMDKGGDSAAREQVSMATKTTRLDR